MRGHLSDNGSHPGTRTTPVVRPFEGDHWRHQVVGRETPRGFRYRGVVTDGAGRVVAETRWHVCKNLAAEAARGVAVHHNVRLP